MTTPPIVPDHIEKTMSASLAEFQRSMAVLLPSHAASQSYACECGGGTVTVTYQALPPAKLSALISMPRARVTIHFSGVTQPARTNFMCRFDLAFRRGGG